MKTTFIYALTCPDTGEVKYVGKSNNPQIRYNTHIREHDSIHKAKWIESLKKDGKLPGLKILEEVPESEWAEAEKRWITYYLAMGSELTNTVVDGQPRARNKITESEEVVKFTMLAEVDLNDWLSEQANLHGRSKTKHIEWLLKQIFNQSKEP